MNTHGFTKHAVAVAVAALALQASLPVMAAAYEFRQPLSGVTAPAQAPTPAAQFSVSPGVLNFAELLVGQTASQFLTVQNVGNTAGALSRGAPAAPFAMADDCGDSLAAGASCTATVTFAPTAAGTAEGTLTLGSTLVSLSGAAAALTPAFAVSSTSVTFAETQTGQTATQTVTLANTGTGTGAVDRVQPAAPFSMMDNCGASLAAGASCTATFTFAPTVANAFSDTATLAGQVISLAGTSAAPPAAFTLSSQNLAFAQTETGKTSTQTVTVQNTGGSAGAVSKTQPAAPFSVTDNCGASLAAGASCTATYTFAPTVANTYAGVTSTLAGKTVTMGGTSVAPAPTGPTTAWSGAAGSPTAVNTGFTDGTSRIYFLRNTSASGLLATSTITLTGDDQFSFGTIRTVDDAGAGVSAPGCSGLGSYTLSGCRAQDDAAVAGAKKHLRIQIWFTSYNPAGSKLATLTVTLSDGTTQVLNLTAN